MITKEEFSHVHSFLIAVVGKKLGRPQILPASAKETLSKNKADAAKETIDGAALQWLELLDLAVSPQWMRHYITDLLAGDAVMRAFIRFLVAKRNHSQDDRDKVDWLATQLVRLRQQSSQQPLGWPKAEVGEILQGLEFPPLSPQAGEVLEGFPSLLDEVKYLERFSQITDSHMIERARDLKDALGEEFFHPDVLTANVNYNLTFGDKFHKLLQETMQRIRPFLLEEPESRSPNPREMLESDYRSASYALDHLSELSRRQPVEPGIEEKRAQQPSGTPEGAEVGRHEDRAVASPKSPEDELLALGVDPGRQAERLRGRVKEITLRFQSNPHLTFTPTPMGPISLEEWELSALQAAYPATEESFRAAFARSISNAIGMMVRIAEELPAYYETKGNDTVWKQHHDALVYLLYEGRRLRGTLADLANDCQQRGLRDKSSQLRSTSEKLETSLNKIMAIL